MLSWIFYALLINGRSPTAKLDTIRRCSIRAGNGDAIPHTLNLQIEALVAARSQHRLLREYEAADRLLDVLKFQYDVEVTDMPYKAGGISTWRILLSPNSSDEKNTKCTSTDHMYDEASGESLMWTARNAYRLMYSGERAETVIVESCLRQLRFADYEKFMDSNSIKEMQGRKFADAAFELSLAGVKNSYLYSLLLSGAMTEISRYGRRKTCRPIDILQVVERIAVAGTLDQEIYQLAADMLQLKVSATDQRDSSLSGAASRLSSGKFSLLSDMPLLWLWRFSSRQRKHGNQISSHMKDSNSKQDGRDEASLLLPSFDDPSLPLVVDIGCGFGVSMLGLSLREKILTSTDANEKQIADSRDMKHNFIACDMSHRAVGYASGIAHRWGISGSCCFLEADAVQFLSLLIEEYPGPVECILINFPTPYMFGAESVETDETEEPSEQDKPRGNSQLPTDLSDFMVTPQVIQLCNQLLQKKSFGIISGKDIDQGRRDDQLVDEDINCTDVDTSSAEECVTGANEKHSHRYLIIQANVEDVAVTMKNEVTCSPSYESVGGFSIPDKNVIEEIQRSWTQDSTRDAPAIADALRVTELSVRSLRPDGGDECGNFSYDADVADDNRESEVQLPPPSPSLPPSLQYGMTEKAASSAGLSSALDIGIDNNDDDEDNNSNSSTDSLVSQRRAEKWIASGGERARGHGWLKASPLPSEARTETEAMCTHNKKAVHRIMFVIKE